MDTALPEEDIERVKDILDPYTEGEVRYHALRTRRSGARRFVSLHILVPGNWSVERGHHLLEKIESDIRAALPNATVFTHLESLEDASSWEDQSLDR
jgi:divalent metal cation (Fe/Co/Zn/Cd) transporter